MHNCRDRICCVLVGTLQGSSERRNAIVEDYVHNGAAHRINSSGDRSSERFFSLSGLQVHHAAVTQSQIMCRVDPASWLGANRGSHPRSAKSCTIVEEQLQTRRAI
jgi:hypothetical protein